MSRPAHLEVDGISLKAALVRLQQTSGVAIVFSEDFLPARAKVSCACKDVTVGRALDILLTGTTLGYSELRANVVIEPRADVTASDTQRTKAMPTDRPGLTGDPTLVVYRNVPAPGAPRTVSQTGSIVGQVTDAATARPLEGAQIALLRTSLGVIARADGRYAMPAVPPGSYTLEVRYIGYGTVTREVTVVGNRAVNVDLALTTQAIKLDELVVTGTGVVTERRRLGATVATVNTAAIQAAPAANLMNVLSGRISGMLPEMPASLGSAAPIFLRGGVSLNQRNQPLIYIDGVRIDNSFMHVGSTQQASSLDRLNPNDIDHVEVIKGAAAATLYGTEASAGVIQIITKRGMVSEPQWDFGIGVEGTTIPQPRVKESWGYDFDTKKLFGPYKPACDYICGWGAAKELTASVRGGSPSVQYFGSARYRDETGTMDREIQGVTDANLRTGLNIQATDRLGIRVDLSTIRGNTRQPNGNFQSNGSGYLWGMWLATPANADAVHPYGGRYLTQPQDVQWPPPNGYSGRLPADSLLFPLDIAPLFGRKSKLEQSRLTVSGAASFQWTPAIRSEFIIGRDQVNDEYVEHGYKGIESSQPLGFRSVYRADRTQTTIDLKTSWIQDFGPSATSTFVVGGQSFKQSRWVRTQSGRNFSSPVIETLAGAAEVLANTENFLEVINTGLFAQEEIGLRNRIFVNAGMRVDGNSAFGENFGFEVYPKAGASWVVSDESFWPFGARFNQFRIRGALGAAGLQPGAFDATQTWIPDASVQNLSIVRPGNPGNPDLKPERSLEIELAGEFGFSGGRIGSEIVYYHQHTKDALLPAPTAPSLGFNQQRLTNLGRMSKHGVETSVDIMWIDRGALRFSSSVQTSYNKSKVESMGGLPCYRLLTATSTPGRRYNSICTGHAPGDWIGPVKDPKNPYKLAVPVERLTNLNQITPNILRNSLGTDSLAFQGHSYPVWTGGFSCNLDLPGGLSVFTLLNGGYDYYMFAEVALIQDSSSRTSERVSRMAQGLDDSATTTAERQAIADDFGHRHPTSVSDYLMRADFVRWTALTLNWRIPAGLTGQLRVKSLSVRVSAQNLYLWNRCPVDICMADPLTPEHGDQDAEQSGANQAFAQNMDYGNPPGVRRFGIHLRAGL